MKNWEDIIREKLSSIKGKAAPGQDEALWRSIEGQLPGSVQGAWWSGIHFLRASSAVVVLLLAGAFWWVNFEGESLKSDVDASDDKRTEVERLSGNAEQEAALEVSLETTEQGRPLEPETVGREVQEEVSVASNSERSGRTEIEIEQPESSAAIVQKEDVQAGVLVASAAVSSWPDGVAPTPRNVSTETDALPIGFGGNPIAEKERGFMATHFEEDPGVSKPGAPEEEDGAAKRIAGGQLPVLALLRPRFPVLGTAQMEKPASLDMPTLEPTMYRSAFAIRAYGGSTFSHFTFSDAALAAYSENFATDYSATGGISLEVIRGGQQWSVGVNVSDYVHRLEFEETTENEWWTEGVQSIEINAITGDTVAVNVGQVQGTQTTRRFVRHHGRYSVIAVPLEWRTQSVRGRWHLGLGIGALLHIRRNASGSILNAEGVLARYADADLSKSRMSWMPTARTYVGYQFAPSWRLDLSVLVGQERHSSKKATPLPGASTPEWNGRLLNGQFQVGITRYFLRHIR
jgi:hypothetical protein